MLFRGDRDHRWWDDEIENGTEREPRRPPGKRTLVEALTRGEAAGDEVRTGVPGKRTRAELRWQETRTVLQMRGQRGVPGSRAGWVRAAAAGVIQEPGAPLPHQERLQRAFGPEVELSTIRAHIGGAAADACETIGAEAFAAGEHVAFARDPDLHTAAHEVAHVLQQRVGVTLDGGVGRAGDHYEREADAIADRVVRGESVAGAFDPARVRSAAPAIAIAPAPAAPAPANGATALARLTQLAETVGGGATLVRLGAPASAVDAAPPAEPAGSVQGKGAMERLADALGTSPLAAQLVGTMPALEQAVDIAVAQFVERVVIPFFDLDRRVKQLLADALFGYVPTVLSAIETIEQIVEIWLAIPEPARAILLYAIIRACQVFENLLVAAMRAVGESIRLLAKRKPEEDVIHTHALAHMLELIAAGGTNKWIDAFTRFAAFVRAMFGDFPVSSGWRAAGLWLVGLGRKGLVGLVEWAKPSLFGEKDTPPDVQQPLPQPQEDRQSAPPQQQDVPKEDAPPPPVPKAMNIGPVAIIPRRFGIAVSSKERGLGGLAAEADLSLKFLESEATLDAPKIKAGAIVDWDGNFRWNVALDKPIVLIDDLTFGIFQMQRFALREIAASNEGIRIGLGVAAMKVGTIFETGEQTFTWDSKDGVQLQLADIKLNLFEPLPPLQGSLDIAFSRNAGLKHLVLTGFKAGPDFEVARAGYAKESGFELFGARYKLPGAVLGPDTWLGLQSLQIDQTGKLKSAVGELVVNDLMPFGADGGVTIGGTAVIGYKEEDGFIVGLETASVSVEKGIVGGFAKGNVVYKQKHGITGKLEKLSLRVGPLLAEIEGATLDTQNRTIGAETGSIVFGGDAKKKDFTAAAPNEGALGGIKDFLGTVSVGEVARVTAIRPRFEAANGFKYDRIEKSVKLPRHARFDLFGGLVSGAYDLDKKEASLGVHFAYPPAGGKGFLPQFTAEYHFVPGLGVFVEVGLTGGISVDLTGSIKGKQDNEEQDEQNAGEMQLASKATVHGHIGVRLAGGLVVGTAVVGALRAYLEASAALHAQGTFDVAGRLVKSKKDGRWRLAPPPDGTIMSYLLHSQLVAKVDIVADVTALMFYSHQLFRHNLKTWALGEFNFQGHFSEDENGKLKHTLVKPDPKVNGKNDPTFGGAFDKAPELDRKALEPIPVQDAVYMLAKQGKPIDDRRLMNRLITKITEADNLGEQEKASLMKLLKQPLNGVKDKDVEHTDSQGATKTIKTAGALIEQYEADAKAYRAQRELVPGVTSRIMTLQQWLNYSSAKRPLLGEIERGDKVKKLDEAIKAYHEIAIPKGGKPDAIAAAVIKRLEALEALRLACDEYMAAKTKRFEMATDLLFAIEDEKPLLEGVRDRALAAAKGESGGTKEKQE